MIVRTAYGLYTISALGVEVYEDLKAAGKFNQYNPWELSEKTNPRDLGILRLKRRVGSVRLAASIMGCTRQNMYRMLKVAGWVSRRVKKRVDEIRYSELMKSVTEAGKNARDTLKSVNTGGFMMSRKQHIRARAKAIAGRSREQGHPPDCACEVCFIAT